jgi:aerobic-type carbon monoxide dehydrogenase small subunit (CoxS/CutS family)
MFSVEIGSCIRPCNRGSEGGWFVCLGVWEHDRYNTRVGLSGTIHQRAAQSLSSCHLEVFMISLKVNGKNFEVDVPPETPLLWVIRENIGLTGTKFGCGVALCGTCTVHVNGKATRSCVTPVSSVAGKEIVTIEGLSANGNHPVQQAWIADDVPQCGYCHSGQIMTAAALLATNPNPSDADINDAMSGNICRCGTYQRIRRAIHRAGKIMAKGGKA